MADIAQVPTRGGRLCLAVVLDVFTRCVVGWAMAAHVRTALGLAAQSMALANRRPARGSGLIYRSDQDGQDAALALAQRLQAAGSVGAPASAGDRYENALAEDSSATLKAERAGRLPWDTHPAAERAVFGDIGVWHHRHSRHSSLKHVSFAAYRRRTGALPHPSDQASTEAGHADTFGGRGPPYGWRT